MDDFDSEYIGSDGSPDDLHGIYAFKYVRNVRCHACDEHTDGRTDSGKVEQYSVWAESAISKQHELTFLNRVTKIFLELPGGLTTHTSTPALLEIGRDFVRQKTDTMGAEEEE